MKKILLIALLYLPIKVFSQNNVGTLQLFIYPEKCKISIDDTLIVSSKSRISLLEGTHKINITAPKIKTISEQFNVYKDSTTVYRKILQYNDAYKTYKGEMIEYNLKKGAMITTTSLIAGLTLYLTYNYTIQASKKQNEAYDLAMEYKSLFENSFNSNEITNYRNSFNKYKDDYYKYKKQKYYALPVVLVGSFLTYKSYKFTKSIKKPKYIEPLSFNYNLFNNQFYISYEF